MCMNIVGIKSLNKGSKKAKELDSETRTLLAAHIIAVCDTVAYS